MYSKLYQNKEWINIKNHLITIKTDINPHKATKYGLFEHIKSNFCDENPTNMQRFFAGATAGAVSQTIIYPMEVIKTRMVLRATGQYSNSFDLISYGLHSKIIRKYISEIENY